LAAKVTFFFLTANKLQEKKRNVVQYTENSRSSIHIRHNRMNVAFFPLFLWRFNEKPYICSVTILNKKWKQQY